MEEDKESVRTVGVEVLEMWEQRQIPLSMLLGVDVDCMPYCANLRLTKTQTDETQHMDPCTQHNLPPPLKKQFFNTVVHGIGFKKATFLIFF